MSTPLDIVEVVVRPIGDAPLDVCVREAIRFSLERQRIVRLKVGGREYVVNPSAVMSLVLDQHPPFVGQ